MRIRVDHETTFAFGQPARSVIQILRLTPRSYEGQHVVSWKIEPSVPGRLRAGEDHLGNLVHTFEVDGPLTGFAIRAWGEVDTQDVSGVVRDTVERAPAQCYLRQTRLTEPNEAMRDFASSFAGRGDSLAMLHALMTAIHEGIEREEGHGPGQIAAAAFEAKRGNARDMAQIFIAVARELDIPCRFVSGYICSDEEEVAQAPHAWAEAMVPNLGWVGFDPATGLSTTDAHVRVAIGLDRDEAAPIRGSRRGGDPEELRAKLAVEAVRRQRQD